MPDLKPCPFCGGKATFLVSSTFSRGVVRGWEFRISCTKCGVKTAKTNYRCEVSLQNGEIVAETDERPAAIKAWNRRAGEEDKYEDD